MQNKINGLKLTERERRLQSEIMDPLKEKNPKRYKNDPVIELIDYKFFIDLDFISRACAKDLCISIDDFISIESLVDIVKKRPKTKKALSKIYDLTPAIVDHYGNSYIEVIKKYTQIEKDHLENCNME